MISDLLSNRKILFYVTYFSCKFISSHVANLLISKCHLADDVFPYVVLTWPWFRAFHAFALCLSLGDVHQGTLTSKGASLVWMNCCWHSGFCSRRSCGLVHQEVGNWIFGLVVWADIIQPVSRVHVPRSCGGVGMAS